MYYGLEFLAAVIVEQVKFLSLFTAHTSNQAIEEKARNFEGQLHSTYLNLYDKPPLGYYLGT